MSDEEKAKLEAEEAAKMAAKHEDKEQKKKPKKVEVIWTKNVRYTDGLHQEGEKSSLTEEEAEELLAEGLIRFPE
ncbi:hypothetical protein [Paenibacillus sp. L3-i20]|uniref:hypothetical protein n=1 Tax=Paenibacillus sp. L3-i20 TaxID=2905833 RepID=UPI001EE0B83C|nr:hypothetical protein [Paenibacillus sp. L3-i20]GKU79864.1 hypothetical protein L3i20_v242610 [Paenibacillus sp. L3-i20]